MPEPRRAGQWRLGKPRTQTAASSLSSRDLWMTGQRPPLYRYWPGRICARGLPARCLRRSRRALAGRARSCRTRSPAFGARPRVPAVPAQVGASAAAIGHHLLSGQADAAHPTGLDVGLPCPVPDRLRLVSYGLPARKRPGRRSGRGAASVDVHRRGGSLEWWVLPPGGPLRQPFIRPVAELGCASVIWPVGRHVQPRLHPLAGSWLCPACARRRTRPSHLRGRAHLSRSPRVHGPEATLRPDKFPMDIQPIYLPLRRVMWTTRHFFLCTGMNGVSSAS